MDRGAPRPMTANRALLIIDPGLLALKIIQPRINDVEGNRGVAGRIDSDVKLISVRATISRMSMTVEQRESLIGEPMGDVTVSGLCIPAERVVRCEYSRTPTHALDRLGENGPAGVLVERGVPRDRSVALGR